MSETGHSKNIAHFSQLLSIVNSLDGSYNPSNPLILKTNLQAKSTAFQSAVTAVEPLEIEAKNTAVINASTAARAARIARDALLYNDTDCILALANLVKKYVKSVFGADSPQYKQLTALKFKKP